MCIGKSEGTSKTTCTTSILCTGICGSICKNSNIKEVTRINVNNNICIGSCTGLRIIVNIDIRICTTVPYVRLCL